ncbi:uncharacterized protein G2W53_011488 [Senna tora]|uniref:Uncharacterized protein n=1 Tax=Senna tora TaxID=362788 RepID=A0A834X287_9FABA|nr:uncharacterized protein G2W53_011488 [Senna tora]
MARNLVGGFTPKALVRQALITFKLQPTTRPLTIL